MTTDPSFKQTQPQGHSSLDLGWPPLRAGTGRRRWVMHSSSRQAHPGKSWGKAGESLMSSPPTLLRSLQVKGQRETRKMNVCVLAVHMAYMCCTDGPQLTEGQKEVSINTCQGCSGWQPLGHPEWHQRPRPAPFRVSECSELRNGMPAGRR